MKEHRVRAYMINERMMQELLAGRVRMFGWPSDAEVVNVFTTGPEYRKPAVIVHVASVEFEVVEEFEMIPIHGLELEVNR